MYWQLLYYLCCLAIEINNSIDPLWHICGRGTLKKTRIQNLVQQWIKLIPRIQNPEYDPAVDQIDSQNQEYDPAVDQVDFQNPEYYPAVD